MCSTFESIAFVRGVRTRSVSTVLGVLTLYPVKTELFRVGWLAEHKSPSSCSMLQPVLATRLWLERVVIGLSLCPWAKPVHERGGVKIVNVATTEPEAIFSRVLHEMEQLNAGDAETTIVVAPDAFENDFVAFNDFLQDAEEYLRQEELDDSFQVVGFHPQFQFGEEDASDASNFVNRSPYCSIHVLRQQQVTQAIQEQPKLAESVPKVNQKLLRGLGALHMRRLLNDARRDSGIVAMLSDGDDAPVAAPQERVIPRRASPRAVPRRAPPPRACTSYAPSDWDASWWEDGLTVVEYDEPDGSGLVKLGVYVKYSVVEAEPHIRPLCASAVEDGVSSLLCDEEVGGFHLRQCPD